MSTTQYMLLVLPTPGVTNDFTGEQQEVAAFTTVDAHDHSPGKGTYVTPAGLLINADLPFAGFNASGLRAVRMNSQSSTLALLLDVNCIYSSGGNLYFNNGSGQAVQITSGAALSASSIGGISGLAAPASVAYSGGTYVFTSNTNIAAIVDMGPVIIRDTGVSARGITLASPAGLASAYQITLPTALPASTALLSMSAAGVLSTVGTISGGQIGGITDPTSAQQVATKNYVDTGVSPRTAKAWARLDCGGSGAVTVTKGQNVASASYSTNTMSVVFTSAMADANYAVSVNFGNISSNNINVGLMGASSLTVYKYASAVASNFLLGDIVQVIVFD